jgi:hypothetical protein
MFLQAGREIHLEVNMVKAKYMSQAQNLQQTHVI